MSYLAKQEQSTSSLQCLGAVAIASNSSRTNVYRAKTSDLHEAISGLAPNLIREPPAVRLCVTFPDTCTCHLAVTAFRYETPADLIYNTRNNETTPPPSNNIDQRNRNLLVVVPD